jgi:hypothetical protein
LSKALPRRGVNTFILSSPLLALGACGGTAQPEPEVQTLQWRPVRLAVNSIEIVDNSVIEPDADFITRRRVDELRTAVREYLANRYVAAGGDQVARMSIEEARLVEQPVPTTEGFGGIFRSETDARLDGALAVQVTIVDLLGLEQGYGQARVTGNRSMNESMSVIERDGVAKTLMGNMVDEMDQSLRKVIEQYLGDYIAF